VLRAAAQLDYLPNLTASSLRLKTRETHTIGMLLQNSANPFSSALHRAVGDVAQAHGYDVLSGSVDESAVQEKRLAAKFAARRVDGLVVVPASHDQSYLANELRLGMALVFLDRPAERIDADAILSDNRRGSQQAVLRLISLGHRRIAFMGDDLAIWTAQERFQGYLDALAQAGLSFDEELARHDVAQPDAAAAALSELLGHADPPTAVYAAQNLITIGVIRGLRLASLQHTVALIGFDDFPLSDLVEPAVTVVSQNPHRMGTLAGEILLQRLAGDMSPTQRYVVETSFIERGSGEIRPH
jgi:LacI family transcriptional regulator